MQRIHSKKHSLSPESAAELENNRNTTPVRRAKLQVLNGFRLTVNTHAAAQVFFAAANFQGSTKGSAKSAGPAEATQLHSCT